MQSKRDVAVVHILLDPTDFSVVNSTSTSTSEDLLDYTPTVAAKELEKLPAIMASKIFQEKRKCSNAEDTRPVKITKSANPVSRRGVFFCLYLCLKVLIYYLNIYF